MTVTTELSVPPFAIYSTATRKWQMFFDHFIKTLAFCNALEQAVELPPLAEPEQIDDQPLKNTAFDELNLETVLEMLFQHNPQFYEEVGVEIIALHEQIITHNQSENVQYGIEEPRTFNELNQLVKERWEALKMETCIETTFQASNQVPTFIGINMEALEMVSTAQVGFAAQNLQKWLYKLLLDGDRISLWNGNQFTSVLEEDEISARWILLVEETDIQIVNLNNHEGQRVQSLPFSFMRNENDVWRFVEQMANENVYNYDPHYWVSDMFAFIKTVIYGDDTQTMLACVNKRSLVSTSQF